MAIPPEEVQAYLGSLKLLDKPKVKRLGAASGKIEIPEDKKAEGYVVAGSVVAFTEELSGQDKADILNILLVAQLAADVKFKREVDTEDWYAYYTTVLGNLGFVIQGFQFSKYEASGAGFKMDSVVLEIIGASVTGNPLLILKATLSALGSLAGDDGRLALFDKHSKNEGRGNFQCGPCSLAKNGDIAINIGAFYFSSTEHTGSFLFFHWESANVTMYKGTQQAVLNTAVYSKVRQAVVDKLGNKAVQFVASLDIGF